MPNLISEAGVLGEVENNSFIALPGKGRHSGLLSHKTVFQPARLRSKLQALVMDKEARRATVHGVAKSQTKLSRQTELTEPVRVW